MKECAVMAIVREASVMELVHLAMIAAAFVWLMWCEGPDGDRDGDWLRADGGS